MLISCDRFVYGVVRCVSMAGLLWSNLKTVLARKDFLSASYCVVIIGSSRTQLSTGVMKLASRYYVKEPEEL